MVPLAVVESLDKYWSEALNEVYNIFSQVVSGLWAVKIESMNFPTKMDFSRTFKYNT